jgi:UDP-N-acetylmuramoylalanine--D-glutamate ligase
MAATAGLKEKKIIILGTKSGGVELAKFLIKKSAKVTIVEIGNAEAITAALDEVLPKGKYTLLCGTELDPKFFSEADRIVYMPGFPLNFAALETARISGVQIECELDFVSTYSPAPIVAIVGTKGKSTTAHLLQKMLMSAGKETFANVDQPLAALLNTAKTPEWAIAVLGAAELENSKALVPELVVFTNVYDDFLDRYVTSENYQNVLKEVFRNTNEEAVSILNASDSNLLNWMAQIPGRKFLFSASVPEGFSGAWATKSELHVRFTKEGSQKDYQASLKNFRLRGSHNRENLMAAALAALTLGATFEHVQSVIETVAALPGRTEFIRRLNSVAFYNDSAASIPTSVGYSLKAFVEPIILIAGGRDKNLDFAPLAPHIRQRVKNMILVGEAKEKINRMIGDFTETFLVGTFEEAVLLAYQKSRSGDVILLSPGCDCSDMFPSHLSRGESFRNIISQIAQPRRLNVL